METPRGATVRIPSVQTPLALAEPSFSGTTSSEAQSGTAKKVKGKEVPSRYLSASKPKQGDVTARKDQLTSRLGSSTALFGTPIATPGVQSKPQFHSLTVHKQPASCSTPRHTIDQRFVGTPSTRVGAEQHEGRKEDAAESVDRRQALLFYLQQKQEQKLKQPDVIESSGSLTSRSVSVRAPPMSARAGPTARPPLPVGKVTAKPKLIRPPVPKPSIMPTQEQQQQQQQLAARSTEAAHVPLPDETESAALNSPKTPKVNKVVDPQMQPEGYDLNGKSEGIKPVVTPRKLDKEKEANLVAQLRAEKMRELQWMFINTKLRQSLDSRKAVGLRALAACAVAVSELSSRISELECAAIRRNAGARLDDALKNQLPLLEQFICQKEMHTHAMLSLRSAVNVAMTNVPVIDGATLGGDMDSKSSLESLELEIGHGLEVLKAIHTSLSGLLGDVTLEAQDEIACQLQQQWQATRPLDTTDADLASMTRQAQADGILGSAVLLLELSGLVRQQCNVLHKVMGSLGQLSEKEVHYSSMAAQLAQLQQGFGAFSSFTGI